MKRGAASQEYQQFRFGGAYDDDPYNSDTSSGSIGCGGFLARIARHTTSTALPTFTRSASSPPPPPTSLSSPTSTMDAHTHTNDPQSNEYTSEAEALMVKELTQLSLKERKGIEEEIHGVGDEIIETPALTRRSLSAFQEELNEIGRDYPAYEKALCKSPAYVNDPKLRLQFLRADRFDAARAAKRFVKYFEATIEFFGEEKLCKEITWKDLCSQEGDKECVETCSFWVDDFDQKGRRLAWIFPQYEIYHNYKNQIRNVWYQIMKALKDEETQKKGFIKVVYALGGTQSRMKKTQSMDTELFFKGITLIFEVLPFRLAALHYCFDDPKIRPVIATVQYVIGKAGRLRFRAHYGSHVECQYALMTFGIPRKNIPISDGGDVPASMNKFYNYLENLRKDESDNDDRMVINSTQQQLGHTQISIVRADTPPASGTNGALTTTTISKKKGKGNKKSTSKKSNSAGSLTSIISSGSAEGGIAPSSNDVLLGRGKPFQEYPGNLRLAILVDRYREKYMEAGRCDKAIISQHLVDQIKKADGRFLKKLTSDGPWIEVSDEVARDKVGHGFRTKPRKIFNPVPLKSTVNHGNHANNHNHHSNNNNNSNNNNANSLTSNIRHQNVMNQSQKNNNGMSTMNNNMVNGNMLNARATPSVFDGQNFFGMMMPDNPTSIQHPEQGFNGF